MTKITKPINIVYIMQQACEYTVPLNYSGVAPQAGEYFQYSVLECDYEQVTPLLHDWVPFVTVFSLVLAMVSMIFGVWLFKRSL